MITEQPLNQFGLLEFPMGAEFDGALVGLPGRVFRAAESPERCDGRCCLYVLDEADPADILEKEHACDQIACLPTLRDVADNKYQTIQEVACAPKT